MRSGWGGWLLGFPTFQVSDFLACRFLGSLVLWLLLVGVRRGGYSEALMHIFERGIRACSMKVSRPEIGAGEKG